MALGSGDTRGGNQRGTLNPREEERVRITYKSGVTVPVTRSVAEKAVHRGEAELAVPPKNRKPKKP